MFLLGSFSLPELLLKFDSDLLELKEHLLNFNQKLIGFFQLLKTNTYIIKPKPLKFIAPSKDEIPDKCKPNIAKSTLGPLWLCIPLNGG